MSPYPRSLIACPNMPSPSCKKQPEAEQEFLARCTKPYFIHLVYSVKQGFGSFLYSFCITGQGKIILSVLHYMAMPARAQRGQGNMAGGAGASSVGSVPRYLSKGAGQAWQPGSAKSHDHQANRW